MNADRTSVFWSSNTWIEGEAIRQLERAASLAGMVRVAGFPDLHPGNGTPIGAAMLSQGEFYPYLIGSDAGCGVALYATELSVAKAKPEKWFKKLRDLDVPWDGEVAAWLQERGAPRQYLEAAGTIGHGNHFAELLRMSEVSDEQALCNLGLEKDLLFLMVHSGSRALGEDLLQDHVGRFRDRSLQAGSDEAAEYIARHDNALLWARASRELIAHRFLDQLNSRYRAVTDTCHNGLTRIGGTGADLFLHRKGAAATDSGAVMIAGSRGAPSYLVMPRDGQERNLWSVAHGAGRKWKRAECKGRLCKRYPAESLVRTRLGSFVICEDRELIYEEAPQAYKDIGSVVVDLVTHGLVSIVAAFVPVLTYKRRK